MLISTARILSGKVAEMPSIPLHRNDYLSTTLRQQPDGSAIVITEVSPALAQTPTFTEQFEPELERAARLSHPGILPILDFGVKDGVPYVINPYVSRGTLAGEIHMSGRLPLDRVVEIVAQAADAIDTAHDREVIHCGLAARAVLRGPGSSVMLSDLGLAELIYQAVGVTPHLLPYAAPELLLKAPYTVRVDVYAMGVLAYQMLAGRPPFSGTTAIQYMQAHLRQPLPAVASDIDVPEQVYHVLKRATGKLAHSRYWTARELAHDLAHAAGMKLTAASPRPNRSRGQMITRYRSVRSAPVKQQKNLKVSQVYTEALLRERQNPAEARQMYHQILELWPRMAQGDVLDRLIGLERQMLAEQASAVRIQAQQALSRGDWQRLLRASQELLDVNAADSEAEQMQQMASTMLAAEEQYRSAQAADRLGDTPAAMLLTQELLRAVPNFNDAAGLTVIDPARTPYIHEIASLKAHDSNVLALGFSADGRMLASGSTDKTVQVAWLPRLKATTTLDTFHSWVCALAFSPVGDYLLTGLWDGEIRLWGLPDGDYRGMIAGLVNQMQGMAFARHRPDLIAVAAGSFLTLWRIPSGERVATVREPDLQSVSALDFAQGAPRLICGMTHGTLRVRDAEDPEYPVLFEIPAHRAVVHSLASLAGGQRVASVSHYDTARVTDLSRGEVLFDLRGHEDAVLDVAASATQPLIVTGGVDGTVRLWDAEYGEPLAVLSGHTRAVSRVCLSPDNRLIASADSGGTIRLWGIA